MCQLDVACFFRNHANFLSSGFKISCSLTINFLVLRLLIDWRIFLHWKASRFLPQKSDNAGGTQGRP